MKRISILLLAAASLAVPACSNGATGSGGGDDGAGAGSGSGPGSGSGSQSEWDQILGTRTTDYSAALRIAALRLTGDLPSLTDVDSIASAPDDAGKKAAYEEVITRYLASPAFARQMFLFWRDTFKIGGTAELDTAPALAAKLSVTNGSYMNLFTQATGNCPTVDATFTTFSDAECGNGGPQAGVLGNPGVMSLYFSNLAFRRVRWVQETFDCMKFPAEATAAPQEVGGALPYLGVWPFSSIASPTNGGGRINFQDVSSAICANCHQTINHQAPLFASYDARGVFQDAIAVPTPLEGAPLARVSDWLPPGETTAWRFQKPAADLTAFGAAMAADPDVARCGVARIWNWAFGKTDIVDTLQDVPARTIQGQIDAFTAGGFKIKDLIRAVYTSDDFVKF
ncbi:MAG TPA: hypothetical protein VFT22_29105 [Kofleriaceae bacterium]|nr:hypothetical protein [Kofleriaceae bacterium]